MRSDIQLARREFIGAAGAAVAAVVWNPLKTLHACTPAKAAPAARAFTPYACQLRVNASFGKLTAAMKRATAEMRRFAGVSAMSAMSATPASAKAARRRALRTWRSGRTRRGTEAGFMCRWSRVKCRDIRPVSRTPEHRWS